MPLKATPGAAGLDEAGRGPLAGPVVAAAVILPERFVLKGLNDSKQMTREERDEQERRIRAKARFAVVALDAGEVDRLNILWASMEAMRLALLELSPPPTMAYVDGNRIPPGLNLPAEAVVRGDGKIACIAAASILAKTERDRIMVAYAEEYPQYGFDQHFGYPTPEHLAALREHGPCPIHRRTFGPVRELEQPSLW